LIEGIRELAEIPRKFAPALKGVFVGFLGLALKIPQNLPLGQGKKVLGNFHPKVFGSALKFVQKNCQ
jgi:hypothetical protein